MTHTLKRFFALILAVMMVVVMLPVSASAAETPIVLIGGGDYQQAGDHTNSSANVTNILNQITAAGITSADGFLFIGDYDCETHDDSTETSSGITSLMNTMQSVFSNLNTSNSILVQGNHDYMDSRIDASGGHTFNGYSVFVMNEDDYPNGGGSSSQAKNLSAELDDFLAGKLAEGYSAPIFVTSHVPLHFGPRTNRQGDGKYAKYYFDVLNAYGAEGLNIIFMHGHNHAYGYDEYLGGEAIYLPVGHKINIAETGSQSSYTTETLNFTYMNAGYTGYYNESGYSTSSGTDFLTMTTFQIYSDKVVINRFSEDGLYNMKSAGQMQGDYISSVSVSADSKVYSSAQTITLTAPAERVTLKDTATGITVTGVKTEGSFEDDSDLTVSGPETITLLENAAKCAAYQAYTLGFTNSGSVSITLPVPSTYSASSTVVYRIDGNTMTKMDAAISGGTATFTAAEDGTYAVVSEISNSSSDAVSYARVESVSDLVSGEEYLIIFDCSSQTTSDAFVIPTIATYSSGSSKRVGPDVVVSDGIADESTISGDYDDYLWTLTKSGSGWLIGDGSQNINVTYNSTSSRCELNFTTSGEALTIASASSNPSDADSSSFAVYDSSNYYWQYNTSATLIYGTTSDSYTSRFQFYKRIENTASEPEVDNGWVSMPSGGTYVLDTDGIDVGPGHRYIVVGNNNNYALTVSNGSVGQAAVTVSGNTITVDDPSIYEFYFADNSSKESGTYLLTQDGTETVYHANGNMYYGSDSKGYWHVDSSSNGSYKVYDYDNMNWYLNYGYVWSSEAVSRFAVSSNTRYVRLYKSTSSVYDDTFLRLAGETTQSYTAADKATEATVLDKIYIEVTTDGYYLSDTLDVTADMLTWDTAFDGTTAGTYTATVSYEGQKLGTVTVTVTAGHDFETVTVDATCTEDGSITTKCTICGESTVEVIPATGHSYECTETAATCSEDGKKVYTCSVCEHSYTETIPATGDHSYECTETAATCGAEGKKLYTCSVCFDSYTEVIPATGDHSFVTETVDATCTEAGSVTGTCSVCGHVTSEVIAATGHSYSSTVTAPTCDTAGFTTYTCAACGHSYTGDETAALGHAYDSVVTATCTEDGYTVYTCSVCGHSYNGEAVAAFGHSYESTVVAPTCATAGYTTHVCGTCGDTYTDSEVAALGHSYTEAVTAPTCTEAGFTVYTCTTCGHSYTGDETAALGHDYDSVVTEPTFETEGFTTHTCRVCGDVTVDSYVPVLSHDYETVTVEATCTVDGSVTHTCTTCGYTYTEVLPAPGHSFETTTTEADCVNNGSVVRSCTTCGHVESETIPATGHSYETTRIEPTCTAAGYITYTCACGDVVTEEIPAAGHSYESVYADPTCTETGGTTYTCTACGHSYTDAVAALGHSYEAVSVAPTCVSAGYTTYTCGTCGDHYTADEIAALGHSYGETVTEPTCTASGYTTYTCALCGDSYTGAETAALGHSYSCVESDGYLVYTCGNCGESYSEKIETVSYTKVTSLSSDNSYVITLYSGSKYYALSHKDNKISVTQITVSGNEITSEITEDLVWTYADKKLSYEDGDTTYYLYAQSSSGWWGWFSTPTLTLSTSSSSTVSFSSSKLKVGSYYLRYSNSSVSLNRSATTTYLFIEE